MNSRRLHASAENVSKDYLTPRKYDERDSMTKLLTSPSTTACVITLRIVNSPEGYETSRALNPLQNTLALIIQTTMLPLIVMMDDKGLFSPVVYESILSVL